MVSEKTLCMSHRSKRFQKHSKFPPVLFSLSFYFPLCQETGISSKTAASPAWVLEKRDPRSSSELPAVDAIKHGQDIDIYCYKILRFCSGYSSQQCSLQFYCKPLTISEDEICISSEQ